VLVIESQAGSGKTALLGAAAEIAAQKGLRVLRARAFELERQFGFGVARQLFERSLVDATPEHRLELLDGAARNAARALSVELEEGIPSSSTEAVIHGLYWLALNLTQREPVLLIVDDVQWTDESSWQWLGYLARRIDGGRLGLVVAGRSGTTGPRQSSVVRVTN
jgi:predicted ATPase